ncbi:MAG: DUF1266 domain-containing protein [Treponema sp.]|jgi:hypothetical protein|nr:DUF1266 domain-containing protein [Treponema sp.]
MKKYLIFTVIIFSCTSLLFAELTKEQFWALSLAGIMTEMHRVNRNALNPDEINERNINRWLETLRRDWGVNNREELLETLDSTENNGHAAALKYIRQIIGETMNQGFSIFDIYNKYQLSQRYYNYLKFTVVNWNLLNNRTILAWDLGRNISLCRWGYEVGFLTESEAWEKIMYYARKVQLFYNSWNEYGFDYYLGRMFFASGSGEDVSFMLQTDPLYKKLVTSFWNHLDWYTNLTSPSARTNETAVETIRYKKPEDNDGAMQFRTNDPGLYNKWMFHYMDNPGTDQNIVQCSVKKISGDDDYGYGIFFCVDNSNADSRSFYRLFITVNGRFTVQKMLDGKWLTPPVNWQDSPHLKKGYNVYNNIRIEKANNNEAVSFNVYFNDNLSATFSDNAPLAGVKVGLVTSVNVSEKEMFPYIPVDVRFDY